MRFAQSIADQEIELLEGVAETLPILASRHKLILMTKGNQVEQIDKLARSGLRDYFTAVEVPREKDPDAYRDVCSKYELAPHTTWMIGNSPKSDINPRWPAACTRCTSTTRIPGCWNMRCATRRPQGSICWRWRALGIC